MRRKTTRSHRNAPPQVCFIAGLAVWLAACGEHAFRRLHGPAGSRAAAPIFPRTAVDPSIVPKPGGHYVNTSTEEYDRTLATQVVPLINKSPGARGR